MHGTKFGAVVVRGIAPGFLLGAAWQAIAQDAATPYPNMAAIDQYLMENRGSEIALARSAGQSPYQAMRRS
jgi:hypothetical protein